MPPQEMNDPARKALDIKRQPKAVKTEKNKKNVTETKKTFSENKQNVPFNCPSPYIRINNSPFWSKPHFMQFSLTINDFNGDKLLMKFV